MNDKKYFSNILFILGILLLTPRVFGAAPIQGARLQGAGAAEARIRLLETAESYLGTPYRYAGLDRRGLDCSGLVYLSFRDALNYRIPRTSDGIYNWAEKISKADLQIGDLVFFITTGPEVSHLGIYAGDGRFIHSASEGPRTGVMYSHLSEAYWERTYKGAGRALPWDEEAAVAMAAAGNTADKNASANASANISDNASAIVDGEENVAGIYGQKLAWKDETGFFTEFGAAWTWGGFIEGSPSVFRGISSLAAFGYKLSKFQFSLELRPEWDRALGVFRLPFTLSLGNDIIQFFAGPAYTFGKPGLFLDDGERRYSGGGTWAGEWASRQPFFP